MIIFNKLVVMKKRKKYTSGFKTKVVLEALQERETIQEIAKKYELHPTQVSNWKSQFLAEAADVFEKGVTKSDDEKEKAELFKKVGQLQMEVDFLKKVLGK
jgi:transposase